MPPARPAAAITVASAAPLDMPITGSTAPARPAAREEIAKPVVPAKVAEATKVKAPLTGARALMTAGPSLAMGFSAEADGRSGDEPLHRPGGQAAAGHSLEKRELHEKGGVMPRLFVCPEPKTPQPAIPSACM